MELYNKIRFSDGYDTKKKANCCNRYANQNIFLIYMILKRLWFIA